jgi:hypothetical protein
MKNEKREQETEEKDWRIEGEWKEEQNKEKEAEEDERKEKNDFNSFYVNTLLLPFREHCFILHSESRHDVCNAVLALQLLQHSSKTGRLQTHHALEHLVTQKRRYPLVRGY